MFFPRSLYRVAALSLAPLVFPMLPQGSVGLSDLQQEAILIGAGDIADCSDLSGAEATARLLEANPGTVIALGDLAYPDGTPENFKCYNKTWGRVKDRTRPAVGNHEFHSSGATYYFQYFGAAAGIATLRTLEARRMRLLMLLAAIAGSIGLTLAVGWILPLSNHAVNVAMGGCCGPTPPGTGKDLFRPAPPS